MPAILKRSGEYHAFRISPGDTNYMACVFDPLGEGVDFTCIVEIYEKGGRTPPNTHRVAHEMFFILKGEGRALCDGASSPLKAGDAVLLRPGTEHVLENTGEGKLYALCVMVPNEEFAELIHRGMPVELDAEDLAVLRGR